MGYTITMAFSFFSGSKKGTTLALVIDIGSSSVGTALALFSPTGEKPRVLAGTRTEMVFQEDLNIERFQKAMSDALAESLHEIEKKHVPRVRKIAGTSAPLFAYVVFSSPWHASQTKTISAEQEPFRMTRDILDRIARREIDTFERAGLTSRLGSDIITIEKHIMHVALNGYETQEPFGKEARTLDVGIFMSVIPRVVIENVEKTITRFFVGVKSSFHSFPFVAFDVLRGFPGAPERFLIIDISGEVTDVSVVSDKILFETATFPFGKRTILRTLSRALSTTPDEALSLIRLSDEKRLSHTHTDRVGKALSDSGDEWVAAFEKTLSGLADRVAIPHKLFLSADDDLLPYFTALVKKEGFAQFTLTDEPFSVFPLSSAALYDLCAFEREAPRDPFLMMESAFAQKLFSLS